MTSFSEIPFLAVGAEEVFAFLLKFAWTTLWLAVTWIFPLALLFYGVYFLVSLPLRRQARARLFLDILETGIKQGSSVEIILIAVAESRDCALGGRFHLFGCCVEMGLGWIRSRERVPRLLP